MVRKGKGIVQEFPFGKTALSFVARRGHITAHSVIRLGLGPHCCCKFIRHIFASRAG